MDCSQLSIDWLVVHDNIRLMVTELILGSERSSIDNWPPRVNLYTFKSLTTSWC